jgi:hypothetical protein
MGLFFNMALLWAALLWAGPCKKIFPFLSFFSFSIKTEILQNSPNIIEKSEKCQTSFVRLIKI